MGIIEIILKITSTITYITKYNISINIYLIETFLSMSKNSKNPKSPFLAKFTVARGIYIISTMDTIRIYSIDSIANIIKGVVIIDDKLPEVK